MAWSTAQVARMAGVTSRALRHYDAIGLLPPARVGPGGLRYYDREQLLRLQQILLLRELDLGLDAIAAVLAESEPTAAVLRRHRRVLVATRERTSRLIATVDRTICELEGGEEMNPEQWFEGFDAETQEAYDAEARERWGDEVVDASWENVRGMAKADVEAAQTLAAETNARLAELLDAGVPVDDPRTQEAVDGHYRWVSTFWTPDAASYVGLGRMYVDDARFTAYYDRVRPGLAVYLRDAIAVYADARLA
jgi:MerR family transcriptional regulator, thiopeptide resistance regulator